MSDRRTLRAAKRRITEAYKTAVGERKVEPLEDGALVKYGKDGFDYSLYKEIQTLGNKLKLEYQWVAEDHVEILSSYLNERLSDMTFGLCHGTRRGAEQGWFTKHLTGHPAVIGTEISDTATDFPATIQWDFHDTKDEWTGAADFVYSNSWDHAHDPYKAFGAWVSSLKPGGFMSLDHGPNYDPKRVNELDPFGMSLKGLETLLNHQFDGIGSCVEVIEGGMHKTIPIITLAFRKHATA